MGSFPVVAGQKVDLDSLMERVRSAVRGPTSTHGPAAPPVHADTPDNAGGGQVARAQAEFNRSLVDTVRSLATLLAQAQEKVAAMEERIGQLEQETASTGTRVHALLAEHAAALEARLQQVSAEALTIGPGVESRLIEEVGHVEYRLAAEAEERSARIEQQVAALCSRLEAVASRVGAIERPEQQRSWIRSLAWAPRPKG